MSHNVNRREVLKGSLSASMGIMAGKSVVYSGDENPFPPKKIIRKEPLEYSPLAYLEKIASESQSQLAFKALNLKEAETWQKNLRLKLWELLGEQHIPGAIIPEAKLIETKEFENYTREKWVLNVVPGRSMPFYILFPKTASKSYKTVLCLHGHGNGVSDIIGMPKDESARELIKILNYDYAVQCVKKGWCAVAPELFAFGERMDYVEDARPGFDGGCEKPFLNAVQYGKTLSGIRTKDVCALIDWLAARNNFTMENLTCIGLSGGGMLTMYVSALDERIKRVLIAGYLTMSSDSILALRHCSCNYVPGLGKWADFPDITGLIAPRYLIVQSGKKDAIFPIESVRTAVKKVGTVYSLFNKSENLNLHEHAGYHSFWSLSLDDLLV